MTLDDAAKLCQSDTITAPVPEFGIVEACVSNSGNGSKTSRWGGPRPGFGGPQPGSGRPRKQPIIAPTIDTALHWAVIAFWGQADQSATTDLTRQGYETYLPMVAIRRRDPVILTKWHIVRVSYLPGYGFIRITQIQSREPITETRGVREVLRRPDGRLAWVRDAEIDAMRANDADRLKLPATALPVIPVGKLVRIEDGPFADHTGTVQECDGIKTQVEIVIFGRPTTVWLDRGSVVEREVP